MKGVKALATIIEYEPRRAPIIEIAGVRYRCHRLDPRSSRPPIRPPSPCECGCGEPAKPGNKYINGHQNRGRSSMNTKARQLSRERSWDRYGRCEAITKSGERCRRAQNTWRVDNSGLCIQHIRLAKRQ